MECVFEKSKSDVAVKSKFVFWMFFFLIYEKCAYWEQNELDFVIDNWQIF